MANPIPPAEQNAGAAAKFEQCIIIYRNTGNDRVGYVRDGDGDELAVYRDHEAAERDVPNIPILRAFPYQIVTLDELPSKANP